MQALPAMPFWRSMAWAMDSPFMLQVEIDQAGHSAAGRCDAAGFKVILGIGPHEGHGQMGVGVDDPGQKVFAFGS